MIWLFALVYWIWFGSEIYLLRRMRSGKAEQHADRGTLRMLWAIILAGNTSAAVVSGRMALPIGHPGIRYIGLGIVLAGVALRMAGHGSARLTQAARRWRP